jgi:hypothetical protein
MAYPAYYGRPALVAGYRRPRAPASVHVVALFQYLGGLLALFAATGVILFMYGHGKVLDEQRVRIPELVRRRIVEGEAGLVMAVATAIVALVWLIVARALQRGQQWARITMLMLSLMAVAGTGYDAWLLRRPQVLAGLAGPVLFLTLLNTRAARSWFRWGTW